MMDVTVKTLDSQTRQFSVPEQITVKEFKEKISGSVNIPAATQRLIFGGRVLQDSKKLSEYEVNGRTIHLVEKPPPSTTTSGSGTSSSSSTTSDQPGSGMHEGRDSIFMGAITVQADVTDSGNIHVQPNGSHMDVHINLGPINVAPPVSASQQRVNQIRNLMRQVNVTLERLENPTQQQGTQTEPVSTTSSGTPDSTPDSSAPSGPSSTSQANQQSASTTGAPNPMPETGPNNQRRNSQGPNGQPGNRGSIVVHPRGTVMADILTEIDRISDRLQPFLNQYRQLLAGDQVFEGDSDRQASQHLQTLVNQALHYISHIYHAVSDCMMDLHTPPPRVLRAPAGMMVGPIRPPAQMPVQVNIGPSNQGSATRNASTPSTDDQPQPQPSQTPSDQSNQTDRNASTRTSATSTTQTNAREQTMPMLTNASVTLTNQQTFVITPRSGVPGFMAVPVSSSSNQQPPPAAGTQQAQSGAQSGTQGGDRVPGNQANQSGPAPGQQGPHVHIHQLRGGAIPPAGLLQAMAQMVGQQQMHQMAQFPANHAGPTSTSSTPTTSSPRSQQNSQSTPSPQNQQSQARQAPPAPPPMAFFNPLQPRQAWDPLLPCNSRHISIAVGTAGTGRAGSTRQNAGSGTDGTVDSTVADTIPGENARAESVQSDGGSQPMPADNNLSEMLGGIVSALLNPQQQPFVQVVAPGTQTSTQQGTRQGQQQQGSTATSSSSSNTTESSGRGGQPVTDHMLINMMMRMTQEMAAPSSGQGGGQSMREFLDRMGMSLESGDGFIGELLDLVTQQLGISDFMAMFLGQPAPLERLRPTLQQFVNERVMQGQPMTTENIQAAVGRIMTEMEPSVTEFIGDGPTVENIDPVASHMRLFENILERFLNLFKPPMDESSFAEQLRSLGQNTLRQWVALMLRMFGDRENVDSFLSQRLRSWFGGTDSASGNLVASMSLQNFDLAYRTLGNTPEQVAQFIVKKKSPATGSDATPAASGSPVATEQRTSQSEDSLDQVIIEAQILVEEPMDTLVAPEQAQVEAVAHANLNGIQRAPPTNAAAAAMPIPTTTRAEDGAIGGTDSNGWGAAVPAEWVPVINQDVGRQRRQAPQSGLSDAYLSGMPPKRMKLTQDRKAPINHGVETFLPDTLRRAVQATGAQPQTSMQSLLQEAGENPSLHEACEEQIRSAVQERLRRDPDSDPQRFPKTDQYIYKKK